MKNALYKSLALHLAAFLIIIIDVPFLWHRNMTINQVPIIVDLNDVKISEMTNLPPKAKRGKEEKAASKIKRKIENNYTREEKQEPARDTVKTMEKDVPAAAEKEAPEPKQDFLVAPQPRKPKTPVKKPESKAAPKPVQY